MDITTNEKLELLRPTIEHLYSKEGRSKSYISKLLKINRKKLSDKISEWNLPEAEPRHHLTPSNQKFANAKRELIISRLNSNVSITKIAEELDIPRTYLQNVIITGDSKMTKARNDYISRMKNGSQKHGLCGTDSMDPQDLPNEIWKPILGYKDYQISNMGRIKNFSHSHRIWHLVKTQWNAVTGREYVTLYQNNKKHSLQVARLVAHAFVPGYTDNAEVRYKNGNPHDNHACNLMWNTNYPHENSKTDHSFKLIKYKNHYEFKTVSAFAKFLGMSETQTRRWLDKPSKHDIKLIR